MIPGFMVLENIKENEDKNLQQPLPKGPIYKSLVLWTCAKAVHKQGIYLRFDFKIVFSKYIIVRLDISILFQHDLHK